jgi:hypothetical protein
MNSASTLTALSCAIRCRNVQNGALNYCVSVKITTYISEKIINAAFNDPLILEGFTRKVSESLKE